jgi:STE24 endopeptidase
MMTIVPVFIMPLFNKYEPLPDGELKSRIYQLADSPRLKYPLKKLFVMDGSKRSSHSNAFMFGFGSNKRIGESEKNLLVVWSEADSPCN